MKTITFAKPIEHDGKTVSAIDLREPLGGEVLAAEKARAADPGPQEERIRDTVLIAAVCGLDEAVVRKFPASRFKEAAQYLMGFVEGKPLAKADQVPERTIELDGRIERHGRIVTALELREPASGEVEEAERKLGGKFTTAAMRESQFHLIVLVSELPRSIIDVVPISKLNEASQYLLGFI